MSRAGPAQLGWGLRWAGQPNSALITAVQQYSGLSIAVQQYSGWVLLYSNTRNPSESDLFHFAALCGKLPARWAELRLSYAGGHNSVVPTELHMILAERGWNSTILPMIIAGRGANPWKYDHFYIGKINVVWDVCSPLQCKIIVFFWNANASNAKATVFEQIAGPPCYNQGF